MHSHSKHGVVWGRKEVAVVCIILRVAACCLVVLAVEAAVVFTTSAGGFGVTAGAVVIFPAKLSSVLDTETNGGMVTGKTGSVIPLRSAHVRQHVASRTVFWEQSAFLQL